MFILHAVFSTCASILTIHHLCVYRLYILPHSNFYSYREIKRSIYIEQFRIEVIIYSGIPRLCFWHWFVVMKYKTNSVSMSFVELRLESNANLATNGRVVFATVDLNEGNGHDPSTGIFIAPEHQTPTCIWHGYSPFTTRKGY